MDCLDGLKQMDSGTVDLTVTSPPYDNLRTYNGFTWDFEGIAKELFRVTKQGGVIVWVVNDSTINGSETGTSFRQALYFKEIGFNLHDTMIYAKNNPTPYHHNRYNPSFEYMFILSKQKPKTFNPIQTQTQKKKCGTFRYPDGTMKVANTPEVRDWKMLNNIFYYSVGIDHEAKEHPAKFPEQLANDHVLSWSNEGDTILDPFMGSGTTAKIAIINKRNYIGFEISAEYCEIANERIKHLKNNDNM